MGSTGHHFQGSGEQAHSFEDLGSPVELQISHCANFTPCEELVPKRHFWQCEICVWSISIILGSKICAQFSHFYIFNA